MKTAILLAAMLSPLAPLTSLNAATSSLALAQPDRTDDRAAAHKGPVITVSGSGLVERKPDFAYINVGVQVREKSAGAAASKAGSMMKEVADAVRELDINGMQLQTGEVSLNPAYVWRNDDGEQRQDLVGYDATISLRVRVNDAASIGKVIDAAVEGGANRIFGISFELKDALAARQEALALAARSARDKAQTLAEALGLRITGVVSVTSSSDSAPPWQPMSNRMSMAEAANAGGMGDSIEPGMVSVRAEASVTFAAEAAR